MRNPTTGWPALVDYIATDVIKETQVQLGQFNITDLSTVRSCVEKTCCYAEPIEQIVLDMKRFLRSRLYRPPRLVAMSDRTRMTSETVSEQIRKDPKVKPPRFQQILKSEKPEILIAYYIAGVTYRYAEKVYKRLA